MTINISITLWSLTLFGNIGVFDTYVVGRDQALKFLEGETQDSQISKEPIVSNIPILSSIKVSYFYYISMFHISFYHDNSENLS